MPTAHWPDGARMAPSRGGATSLAQLQRNDEGRAGEKKLTHCEIVYSACMVIPIVTSAVQSRLE